MQLPGGGMGVVQAAGADGVCTVAAAEAGEDGQLSVPPGARTFAQVRRPSGPAQGCLAP